MPHSGKPEDNIQKSVVSSHHVGSRDGPSLDSKRPSYLPPQPSFHFKIISNLKKYKNNIKHFHTFYPASSNVNTLYNYCMMFKLCYEVNIDTGN